MMRPLLHAILRIALIGLFFPSSAGAFVAPEQVTQTLRQERPWPVPPAQKILYAPYTKPSLSKFPGEYLALDSKVLSP